MISSCHGVLSRTIVATLNSSTSVWKIQGGTSAQWEAWGETQVGEGSGLQLAARATPPKTTRDLVEAAAEILRDSHGVIADVWSVTSFNELRREALDYDRQRFLAPGEDHEEPWVKRQLADRQGPVVAATDSIRLYADQIRTWVPRDRKSTRLNSSHW